MPNKTYECTRFSQIQALELFFPNRGQNTPLASDRQANLGICFALSLSWIRRIVQFTGEGASERINAIGSEKNIVDCVQSQMYYTRGDHIDNDTLCGFGFFKKRSFIYKLSERDIKLDTARTFGFQLYSNILKANVPSRYLRSIFGVGNLSERARAVTSRIATPQTHHILAVTYITDGGHAAAHAMACSMSNDVLLVFDPNTGEFRVPRPDIHEFLIELLSYFDHRHTLKTVEVARIA
jgi:hypothetical protein